MFGWHLVPHSLFGFLLFAASAQAQEVTTTVPTQGGSVNLQGFATVVFPPGAFPVRTDVRLKITTDAGYRYEFERSTFVPPVSTPYEVEISYAGKVKPLGFIEINLAIPVELQGDGASFEGYVWTLTKDLESSLDFVAWETIASSPDFITVNAPPHIFANESGRMIAVAILSKRASDFSFANGFEKDTPVLRSSAEPTIVKRMSNSALANLSRPTTGNSCSFPVYAGDSILSTVTVDNCCAASPRGRPIDTDTISITSTYKWRWGRQHKGIDISTPVGTEALAMDPGTVVASCDQVARANRGRLINCRVNPSDPVPVTGWGHYVVVEHEDGSRVLYAHLGDDGRLAVGADVVRGQKVALTGQSGTGTGPHLHLEYYPAGLQGAKRAFGLPVPLTACDVEGLTNVRWYFQYLRCDIPPNGFVDIVTGSSATCRSIEEAAPGVPVRCTLREWCGTGLNPCFSGGPCPFNPCNCN